MFDTFPRDLGFPKRRVCWDMKEFLKNIKFHNGHTKCFTSVYKFEVISGENGYQKSVKESAVIDKIFFDLDNVDTCYDDTMKIHKWCDENKLKHRINFSGKGFHVFIFVDGKHIKNKRECIGNAQKNLAGTLFLDLDTQVVGDIARMVRIPNTFNPRRRRYCIPLTREQFEKNDYIQLRELAKKQNKKGSFVMGTKFWDINKFDTEPTQLPGLKIDLRKLEIKNKDVSKIIKDFPECIRNLIKHIKKARSSYKERFYLILFMKENNNFMEEVVSVLKEILPERKFYHCLKMEQQPQYIFKRDDLLFPSCNTLMQLGYCGKKCGEYGKLIYK